MRACFTSVFESLLLGAAADEEETIRYNILRRRSPFDRFARSLSSSATTPEVTPLTYNQSAVHSLRYDEPSTTQTSGTPVVICGHVL